MPDRVLIAGCGDVGNALATRLLADGCEVWGVRRRVEALAQGIKPWRIDLTDSKSFGTPPAAFDYLFYTASADRRDEDHYRSIYVDGLRNLLGRLQDAHCPLQRILFTSSTAVYGQSRGEWVDENSATEPLGFNGRILLEAEGIVRQAPITGNQRAAIGYLRAGKDTTRSESLERGSHHDRKLDQPHPRGGLRGCAAASDAPWRSGSPLLGLGRRTRHDPSRHDLAQRRARCTHASPRRDRAVEQALPKRAAPRGGISIRVPDLPRRLSGDCARVSQPARRNRIGAQPVRRIMWKPNGVSTTTAGVPDVEREGGVFEALDHLASAEATQVTTGLCGAAIGVVACKRGKVGAALKLLLDVSDLRFGVLFAARGGGALRARVHE